MNHKTRILFFAEAVTLAHVARPIALANGLNPAQYDIVMACDKRYQHFMADEPWQTLPLHSISSQQFLRALASGSPVYNAATLRNYVREDLQLIEQNKPDIIVGDFRLSLSISARLVGIPYITITNTYWSPYYHKKDFPLPVLPMTRLLPIAAARILFRLAQPLAFALHCAPLNRVRREHGLPSLGNDLRQVYTDADHTLYADIPEMFPTDRLPSHHHYIGPILWSPPVAKPAWWAALPTDLPIIYLTLGSSGQARHLTLLIDALAALPVTVIAATAGAATPTNLPSNVRIADYLPGTEAAARAQLVVCNGGSLTCQQALNSGVPVLGIADNMDQFMNMAAIVEAGAGKLLRADRLDAEAICAAVMEILDTSSYAEGAAKLAAAFDNMLAPVRFSGIVKHLTSEMASANK